MPNIKFKLRRGTTTQWSANNPILSAGEPGFDSVTGLLKIGNGVDRWNVLPSVVDASAAASQASATASAASATQSQNSATAAAGSATTADTHKSTALTHANNAASSATLAATNSNGFNIGTTTTSAPGSAAEATITGTAPNRQLNLTLPRGVTGRGVTTIARTSGTGVAGATDTYTITYSDSTTSTYTITNGTNGRAVTSIARTSGTGAAGTTDTYTITYSDSTTSTFTVLNGANGTGTGDVNGPASAVDARVATYSGTTGKLLADGGATVANIRDRTTHTGAQAISTITSLQTTLDAKADEIVPTTGAADSKYFRDVLVWSNSTAGAVNDNILITTPITASNTMFTIRIRGYYFLTSKSVIDLTVSGYYNSSPGINNASQINNGTAKLQATTARNPTTGLLDIVLSTLDGGQFGYPKIVVDAMLGHTLPPDSFGTGWSAVRSTTAALPTYTVSTIPTLIDPVARANHTGTQSADTITDGTANKVFLAAEKTKLTGIATGATANDTDANLKARANHTGTQSADTLTDGTTNKAFLTTERTKLTGIATGATANATDAQLRDRTTHTGTQAVATITGLATVATSGLKADVGLANVDNTSDANKPVSTAQLAALDLKVEPYTFAVTGALLATPGKSRIYLEGNFTVVSVRLAVGTAPGASNSIVADVNKNGTTIYTTQANRPTVTGTANTATANAPDVTTFVLGDYLTVDVDTVTGAPADLTVTIRLRRTS